MSALCGPNQGNEAMKYVATAFAAATFLWLVAPVSAQSYYPTAPGVWPEMVDDGCCTDFPTHSPTDWMADQLNAQVLQFNAGVRMTPP